MNFDKCIYCCNLNPHKNIEHAYYCLLTQNFSLCSFLVYLHSKHHRGNFSGLFTQYITSVYSIILYKCNNTHDWCGSVGWVSSHKLKGCWFNSGSSHMPGMWVRSPAEGMRKAIAWCFSGTWMLLSLFFSLPSLFSMNK